MFFEFCPQCGTKLLNKQAGDDGLVPFCVSCNDYWFDIFHTCIIVLVVNELNELALLRQSYLSDRYASFVAGYMTSGETAEMAASREVKEELGIDVLTLKHSGTYWFGPKNLLMIGYIASVKKSEFILSVEVDSASWVKAEDVPKSLFPKSSDNAAYAIYEKFMQEDYLFVK